MSRAVLNEISRMMLSGWTMTASTCPVTGCNTPLLRKGAGELYCASCAAPIRAAASGASVTFFTEPTPAPRAQASREERSATASKLLGQKLLQGWRMLADACRDCGTPLMMPKGSDRTVCVLCSFEAGSGLPAGTTSSVSLSAQSDSESVRHGATRTTVNEAGGGTVAAGVSRSQITASPHSLASFNASGSKVPPEIAVEEPPGSSLAHLRGRADSPDDDDMERNEDSFAERIAQRCGADWAEAFQEVRRGIDSDTTIPPPSTSQPSTGASTPHATRSTFSPKPTAVSVGAAMPNGSQSSRLVSRADGNIGPSGSVEVVPVVFTVPEPDQTRIAALAAAMQRADEEDAAARSASPAHEPATRLQAAASTAAAAASPAPIKASAVTAAENATAVLVQQLEREARVIAGLQQSRSSRTDDILSTAPAIAESASRLVTIAAAITALRPLLASQQ